MQLTSKVQTPIAFLFVNKASRVGRHFLRIRGTFFTISLGPSGLVVGEMSHCLRLYVYKVDGHLRVNWHLSSLLIPAGCL